MAQNWLPCGATHECWSPKIQSTIILMSNHPICQYPTDWMMNYETFCDQLNWEQRFWHHCNEVGMMSWHEPHKKTSHSTTNRHCEKVTHLQVLSQPSTHVQYTRRHETTLDVYILPSAPHTTQSHHFLIGCNQVYPCQSVSVRLLLMLTGVRRLGSLRNV